MGLNPFIIYSIMKYAEHTIYNIYVIKSSINHGSYRFFRTMSIANVDLTASCNSNCGCTTESYSPVCAENGVFYFSQCHAGCLGASADRTVRELDIGLEFARKYDT